MGYSPVDYVTYSSCIYMSQTTYACGVRTYPSWAWPSRPTVVPTYTSLAYRLVAQPLTVERPSAQNLDHASPAHRRHPSNYNDNCQLLLHASCSRCFLRSTYSHRIWTGYATTLVSVIKTSMGCSSTNPKLQLFSKN